MSEATGDSDLRNHLIIVGFGLNGRNLSRAASVARIPRTIIELNPDTVRREKAKGEPIFQGDASHESVLSHAGIKQARVMVIVISDPGAARRIVDTARRLNPTLHIIARTRFFSETEPLYELGANEVIPEDYEASVEVLARVLTKYLVPRDEIEKFAAEFRADHYRMLRSIGYASPTLSDLMLRIPDMEIASLAVSSQSEAVGKSLSELDMRGRYGVTILAIGRGSEYIPNPSGSERMQDGDVAVVIGAPERIAQLSDLFRSLRKA